MDSNTTNNNTRKPAKPNFNNQKPARPNFTNTQQSQHQPQPQQRVQGEHGQVQQQRNSQTARPQQAQQRQVQQRPVQNTVQQQNNYNQQPQNNYIPVDNGYGNIDNNGYGTNDFDFDDNMSDLNSVVVNDTVAENKSRGKSDKKKKVKVAKTPEQKQKQKKIITIAGIAIVVILVLVIILKVLTSNSSQHITIVENEPVGIVTVTDDSLTQTSNNDTNASESENTTEEAESTTTEAQSKTPTVTKIDTVEQSIDNPLDLGAYTKLNLTVNTKTAEDKEYTDHDTQVYVRMSQVVTGYDNVEPYIKEYNSKGDTTLSFPEKDEYYKSSNGAELVMYEFEVKYPEDYPTNGSEGAIYVQPLLTPSLYGTTEELNNDEIEDDASNYIVVGENIYGINKLISISLPLESDRFNAGDILVYRYVATVPSGANSDNYRIDLLINLTDGQEPGDTVYFKGADIESTEVTYLNETTTEELDETTTETEVETVE